MASAITGRQSRRRLCYPNRSSLELGFGNWLGQNAREGAVPQPAVSVAIELALAARETGQLPRLQTRARLPRLPNWPLPLDSGRCRCPCADAGKRGTATRTSSSAES